LDSQFALPNAIGTQFGVGQTLDVRAEMEIVKKSNGHYEIAVPFVEGTAVNNPTNFSVFIADLDANATISPASSIGSTFVKQYAVNNSNPNPNPYIHGLEFSA